MTPPRTGPTFLVRWTASCAAGELLGIGVAAGIGYALNVTVGEPRDLPTRLLVVGTMVAAGALEGLSIGFFQWRVLRERFQAMTPQSWIGTTVAVAALGWLVGMLLSTFGAEPAASATIEPTTGQVAVLAVAFGVVVGAVFGAGQWLVLRHHARRAAWWVPANSAAWAAGLAWIYVAASLPDETSGPGFTVLAGVTSGLLAGLSVGAITGVFLLRIPPRTPEPE